MDTTNTTKYSCENEQKDPKFPWNIVQSQVLIESSPQDSYSSGKKQKIDPKKSDEIHILSREQPLISELNLIQSQTEDREKNCPQKNNMQGLSIQKSREQYQEKISNQSSTKTVKSVQDRQIVFQNLAQSEKKPENSQIQLDFNVKNEEKSSQKNPINSEKNVNFGLYEIVQTSHGLSLQDSKNKVESPPNLKIVEERLHEQRQTQGILHVIGEIGKALQNPESKRADMSPEQKTANVEQIVEEKTQTSKKVISREIVDLDKQDKPIISQDLEQKERYGNSQFNPVIETVSLKATQGFDNLISGEKQDRDEPFRRIERGADPKAQSEDRSQISAASLQEAKRQPSEILKLDYQKTQQASKKSEKEADNRQWNSQSEGNHQQESYLISMTQRNQIYLKVFLTHGYGIGYVKESIFKSQDCLFNLKKDPYRFEMCTIMKDLFKRVENFCGERKDKQIDGKLQQSQVNRYFLNYDKEMSPQNQSVFVRHLKNVYKVRSLRQDDTQDCGHTITIQEYRDFYSSIHDYANKAKGSDDPDGEEFDDLLPRNRVCFKTEKEENVEEAFLNFYLDLKELRYVRDRLKREYKDYSQSFENTQMKKIFNQIIKKMVKKFESVYNREFCFAKQQSDLHSQTFNTKESNSLGEEQLSYDRKQLLDDEMERALNSGEQLEVFQLNQKGPRPPSDSKESHSQEKVKSEAVGKTELRHSHSEIRYSGKDFLNLVKYNTLNFARQKLILWYLNYLRHRTVDEDSMVGIKKLIEKEISDKSKSQKDKKLSHQRELIKKKTLEKFKNRDPSALGKHKNKALGREREAGSSSKQFSEEVDIESESQASLSEQEQFKPNRGLLKHSEKDLEQEERQSGKQGKKRKPYLTQKRLRLQRLQKLNEDKSVNAKESQEFQKSATNKIEALKRELQEQREKSVGLQKRIVTLENQTKELLHYESQRRSMARAGQMPRYPPPSNSLRNNYPPINPSLRNEAHKNRLTTPPPLNDQFENNPQIPDRRIPPRNTYSSRDQRQSLMKRQSDSLKPSFGKREAESFDIKNDFENDPELLYHEKGRKIKPFAYHYQEYERNVPIDEQSKDSKGPLYPQRVQKRSDTPSYSGYRNDGALSHPKIQSQQESPLRQFDRGYVPQKEGYVYGREQSRVEPISSSVHRQRRVPQSEEQYFSESRVRYPNQRNSNQVSEEWYSGRSPNGNAHTASKQSEYQQQRHPHMKQVPMRPNPHGNYPLGSRRMEPNHEIILAPPTQPSQARQKNSGHVTQSEKNQTKAPESKQLPGKKLPQKQNPPQEKALPKSIVIKR